MWGEGLRENTFPFKGQGLLYLEFYIAYFHGSIRIIRYSNPLDSIDVF